jgi:hypothetical protein
MNSESTSSISVSFNHGIDYPTYRDLIKSLLEVGKTTGENHSDAMIAYTKMNDTRMDRWDKKVKLDYGLIQKIKSMEPMKWLIITEGWCGDAAQNIPFIAKLANENPDIDLKLILRDEHPTVMDQYLTNGARSIPVLVMMDENFKELGKWGPRPAPVQDKVMEAKKNPDLDQMAFIESNHKWYASDKNQTIAKEFDQILNQVTNG